MDTLTIWLHTTLPSKRNSETSSVTSVYQATGKKNKHIKTGKSLRHTQQKPHPFRRAINGEGTPLPTSQQSLRSRVARAAVSEEAISRHRSTSCGCPPGLRAEGPGKSTHLPVLFLKFSSAAQSCLTLCDPMDLSTPGFPVLHYLLELAQTHVH